jgi:hypothetical protein
MQRAGESGWSWQVLDEKGENCVCDDLGVLENLRRQSFSKSRTAEIFDFRRRRVTRKNSENSKMNLF